ncbi:hypothetical protein ZTR_11335 [Talaromyces verruculosus]|nr:hypothetical protein ZTR_11335 [Talaromyces verruculosus]
MSAFASTSTSSPNNPRSEFESQRAELVREIALVGNEFSSVEALWSQFENFMGAEEGQQQQAQQQHQQQGQDNRGDGEEGEEGDDDVDVKQEDEYETK